MIRMLIILAIGLVLEAIGVVLISKGQKELHHVFSPNLQAIYQLGVEAVTNRNLILGVVCEAGFFGCLLFLLSRADVSFVWPLTSLSMVVTTLAARWILQEQVSALRWIGVVVILVGAGIVTYTERIREKERSAPSGSGSEIKRP